MKTLAPLSRFYSLGLIVALLVLSPTRAKAQSPLEVPPPSSQQPKRFHYKAKPTPRSTPTPQNEDRTRPSQAQPNEIASPPPVVESTPAPMRPSQPVLPAIFRGCWEGRVEWLDSIERLPGGAKLGSWTPKTYRMCYKRIGDGPFELNFTEAGIEHNRKITNSQGTMQVVSTDGRTYATLRAFLHFDEYHNSGDFAGSTFPVDEKTKLQCDIKPDGMHVWGSVSGTRDGDPWFRAYWHTVFVHVPD